MKRASVTITDAELEQLLSGELTLDSLTRTGTDEAPAASEAQGTAAGEQPARTESEAGSTQRAGRLCIRHGAERSLVVRGSGGKKAAGGSL